MSFILDALKKSEQERKRDQVPDLQSVQVAVRPFRRSSTVKIVLLSVWAAFTLVLMLWWLQQKFHLTQVFNPSLDDATLATADVTMGDADQGDPLDQPKLMSEPLRYRQTRPVDVANGNASPVDASGVPLIEHGTIVDDQSPNHAVRQSKKADASLTDNQDLTEGQDLTVGQAELPTDAVDLPKGAEIIRPRSARPAQSSLSQPPADATTASAAAEDFQYLPELNQMPQSFAETLPKLDFISHLYSSDPTSRSVIINGKTWRERQRIAPELQLLAIIPEGVVLSYRGKQFRMPVIQNWSGQ